MMRVHISYSDRHYRPGTENVRTQWFSCAQIAKYTHEAFCEAGFDVSYGDKLPSASLDLHWTNRLEMRQPNVGRQVYFASVAHFGVVRDRVRKTTQRLEGTEGDGFYSDSCLFRYTRALMQSDGIAVIGNGSVLSTFTDALPCIASRLMLMDCGVDSSHYRVPKGMDLPGIRFVHPVTRFCVRKGTNLVLAAWPRVAAAMPGSTLILLGGDGDVLIPPTLSKRSDVHIKGVFTSGSDEYKRLLSESRWIVLPSLAEGQAGTLLEAMSCGCVPVATRDTGVDADKYGGVVIESMTQEGVADAMLAAAGKWTASLRERVRENTITRHDWSRFQNEVVTFAKDICQHPSVALSTLMANMAAMGYFIGKRFRTGRRVR